MHTSVVEMGWTQHAVEVLIEEYRKRPILYDIKDALYHNRLKKEIAYQQIKDAVCNYKQDCTVVLV